MLLMFAVLISGTLAFALANFENATLSSTSVANLTTTGAFETLLLEGLAKMREYVPNFDVYAVSARPRDAPTRSSRDFQFIIIRVYSRKSKSFYRIQNTLAAPSLWLLPEQVPGPISARYTTWSPSLLPMNLETALLVLRTYGVVGPWISVQMMAYRVNPFNEPDGETYFAFPMFAQPRDICYYVGTHTRTVHAVERKSTAGPDDEIWAISNSTFETS